MLVTRERTTRKHRWRQFNLATLFVVVSALAALLAVVRAHGVAVEKQRLVLKELEPFGAAARWNSDGIWMLEFQLGPRKLADDRVAKLQSLPELWAIDLRQTDVTDQGLRQLAAMPNVHWIYLPLTGIADDAVGDLQARRPDLSLVRFPR